MIMIHEITSAIVDTLLVIRQPTKQMESTLFGCKLNKTNYKAKQTEKENILSTTHHSWYNIAVHVIRGDNRCLRCTVGQLLVMADHQVGVELLFRENSKNLRKVVSPLFVATVRLMWLNRDVVSEDDLESANTTETPQPLPQLCLLPSLGKILSMEQKIPLEFVFKQTSLILRVI
jgi:ribosomal protein S27AE